MTQKNGEHRKYQSKGMCYFMCIRTNIHRWQDIISQYQANQQCLQQTHQIYQNKKYNRAQKSLLTMTKYKQFTERKSSHHPGNIGKYNRD